MTSRTRAGRSVVALALAACVLAACAQPPVASPSPLPTTDAGKPATLRTLAEADLAPATLELAEVTAETDEYTTTAVSYDSGGVTVTGSLSVPTTDGPHPGVVLVHGVVDPTTYLPGSGMVREQDYFAQAGYVALSLDLRSARAEPASAVALGIDLGSTLDVINGVRALQSSHLPQLDEQRIGLLGHSLGGLLVLNAIVTRPELVDAAVALAPASTDARDNAEHLATLFGGTSAPIMDTYGTPEESPRFWSDISARTLVHRTAVPLLIIHGTADQVVPFAWTETTAALWEAAGKEVQLVPLPDEGHVFQAQWRKAMVTASDFLDRELGD